MRSVNVDMTNSTPADRIPDMENIDDVLRREGDRDFTIYRRGTLEGLNSKLGPRIPQMVFVVGGYKFGKSTLSSQLETYPRFNGLYLVGAVACGEIGENETDPLRWLGEQTTSKLQNLVQKYEIFLTDGIRATLEQRIKNVHADVLLLRKPDGSSAEKNFDNTGLLELIDNSTNLQNEIFVKRVFANIRKELNKLQSSALAATVQPLPALGDPAAVPPDLWKAMQEGEELAEQFAGARSKFAAFDRQLPPSYSLPFTERGLKDLEVALGNLPIDDRKRLVLFFDDFDVLVERADLRDSELLMILEMMWRALSNGPLRVVVTSRMPLDALREKRLDNQQSHVEAVLKRIHEIKLDPIHEEYLAPHQYENQSTTYGRDFGAINRVYEAIAKSFKLPPYAGREFMKVTGGQPFLLKELLFAVQDWQSKHDTEEMPDWIAILNDFDTNIKKSKYIDNLIEGLSGPARGFLAYVGEKPETSAWINKLPPHFPYQEKRRLGFGSTAQDKSTEDTLDQLVDAPDTRHILFRGPSDNEPVGSMYLISVGDSSTKKYVAVSRYLLAELPRNDRIESPPEEDPLIERLPQFDRYQLGFYWMMSLAFFWFFYSFVEVEPLWAIAASLLLPLYSGALYVARRLRQEDKKSNNRAALGKDNNTNNQATLGKLITALFLLLMIVAFIGAFLPIWCLLFQLGCRFCLKIVPSLNG